MDFSQFWEKYGNELRCFSIWDNYSIHVPKDKYYKQPAIIVYRI